MLNILKGTYHNGIIKLKEKYPLKENASLKILVVEDEADKNKQSEISALGSYQFGASLDKINIRDFAYED